MKLEDGTYKTKAGSTVTVMGGRSFVQFDWFEEGACFDSEAGPDMRRDGLRVFLHWWCEECGGGCAELTKVDAGQAA